MSRYAMCPECGHRMRRVLDSWGNWDGETYCCDYCTGADYEEADGNKGISSETGHVGFGDCFLNHVMNDNAPRD